MASRLLCFLFVLFLFAPSIAISDDGPLETEEIELFSAAAVALDDPNPTPTPRKQADSCTRGKAAPGDDEDDDDFVLRRHTSRGRELDWIARANEAPQSYFDVAEASLMNRAQKKRRVIVDLTKSVFLDEDFFGVNTMYFLENQGAWEPRRELSMRLREMRVRIIRYPGGTASANFNWTTNRLENPLAYPREPEGQDLSKRTNWTQIMDYAKDARSKLTFTLNVGGAFANKCRPDVAKYAKLAAKWVKKVKADYPNRVIFWEVGNEVWLPNSRYPLSAEVYAKAFKSISLAIKRADPTAKVGLIGPAEPEERAWADLLTPAGWKNYTRLSCAHGETWVKEKLESYCTKKHRWAKELNCEERKCATCERNCSIPFPDKPSWWETAATIAAGHFDFISVHHFSFKRVNANGEFDWSEPMDGEHAYVGVRDVVRNVLKRSPIEQKRFDVAVTAFNIVTERVILSSDQHAKAVAWGEMVIQQLRAGIKWMQTWPMTAGNRTHNGNPLVLHDRSMSLSLTGEVFQMFTSEIGRRVFASSVPDSLKVELVVTGLLSSRELTIFLVNRNLTTKRVELELRGRVIGGKQLVNSKWIDVPHGKTADNRIFLDLAKISFAMVKIKLPKF